MTTTVPLSIISWRCSAPDDRRLAAVAGENQAAASMRSPPLLVASTNAATGVRSTNGDAVCLPAVDEQPRQLRPFVGPVLDPSQYDRAAGAALPGRRDALFAERIEAGDPRRTATCSPTTCSASRGPQVLDCLEFDDRLRFGDVVADVSARDGPRTARSA
jgi:aminoglycoside phosphotransferase family enzyme